jgi:hypothetical protein
MRKPILVLLLCCYALTACNNGAQQNENAGINEQFDRFKARFVEDLWKTYPGWASSQGYHKWDSVLIVPDEAGRNREMAFLQANLDSLQAYKPDELSDNNKTDYRMVENQLNSGLWSIKEQKAWQWDPSQYNVSRMFAEMLNNNYDSLDIRLHHMGLRMANIPAYYAAAQKNILNPTAEHTQLAIDQTLGGLSVFEKDLKDALTKSHLAAN